ncbi:nuclear transition protein 2 [Trichechus inunguis]|uniref:Nuclear transition protein 2 n=1 Tax=Trichechus manatus latirostris TaxID=127582 RepID=A0A2Y9QQ12_TRIMA|nr:nuclear transition protein 2 [Trichechus manatus latirostris]
MDTKTQSLPITQPQPHSNSRSQSHMCSPCSCSHHCQGCSHNCRRSQSCSRSRSSSQSPPTHCSLGHQSQRPPTHRSLGHQSQRPPTHRSLGHQSQRPNPGLPPRHPKQTVYSHHSAMRSTAPGSSYSKNRKTLGGKVNKRKVKRNRRAYKTKRRSSGLHAGGEGPQGPTDEGSSPAGP